MWVLIFNLFQVCFLAHLTTSSSSGCLVSPFPSHSCSPNHLPFSTKWNCYVRKHWHHRKIQSFFLWNIRCVSWLFIFALTKLIYAAWICFVEFQSCHYPQNPCEPTCKGWTLNNSHCVVFAFCFVATTWFLPLNQNPSPTFCRPPTY